jgi:hypothetical protein
LERQHRAGDRAPDAADDAAMLNHAAADPSWAQERMLVD